MYIGSALNGLSKVCGYGCIGAGVCVPMCIIIRIIEEEVMILRDSWGNGGSRKE